MKAKHEFPTCQEYKDYLKVYLSTTFKAALITGVYSNQQSYSDYKREAFDKGFDNIDDMLASDAIEKAEALMIQINATNLKPAI